MLFLTSVEADATDASLAGCELRAVGILKRVANDSVDSPDCDLQSVWPVMRI